MGFSFMKSKLAQMGQGAVKGFQETGTPIGAAAGAAVATHPDSAANKAIGMYDTYNDFKSKPEDPNLQGSNNLQQPELGDSANVGNKQQFGLGVSKANNPTQNPYGLGTMQKRFTQNSGGGY